MQTGTKASAIDIGTHSVRLLNAQFDGTRWRGAKQVIITRLGEGLAQSGVLSDAAMERTVAAVGTLLQDAKAFGSQLPVYCYATSAARQAQNGQALIDRINQLPGICAEIMDETTEAMVAYRGAARPGQVVMDIGGGSTELSREKDGQLKSFSVRLGCVTILERFLGTGGDIGPLQLLAMGDEGKRKARILCDNVLGDEQVDSILGVGGTATQLAMLHLKLPQYDAQAVNGCTMDFDEVNQMLNLLISVPLEQRQKLPGMDPRRADVIVSGCMIARAVMKASGAKHLIASDLDGLDGYLAYKMQQGSGQAH